MLIYVRQSAAVSRRGVKIISLETRCELCTYEYSAQLWDILDERRPFSFHVLV